MNWIKKTWEEIESKPKTVREFGFILTGFFALAPLAAGAIRFFFAHQEFHFRFGWFFVALVAFLINIFLPRLMGFIYHAAMFVALPISWVMMRLVLALLFYLVLSPVSIIMKLIGKDILNEKIDRSAATHWRKRTPQSNVEAYEHLF